MRIPKSVALAALLLSTQLALADASYQTTSQVTGGSFIDALKSNPFSAKLLGNMLAPSTRIIMVHGNQKAEVSKQSTEIIDLDKEVIIHMDNDKKTYTVTTFAQLRQLFTDMSKQMQQHPAAQPQPQPQVPQSDLKISFDASVRNTGVTKVVNGLSAQEQVITVKMVVSNASTAAAASTTTSGQPSSITYVVTTDVWIAPDPPELKQIQEFDVRMGQKMMAGVDLSAFAASMKANASAGMSQMFAGQPGSAEAMAQMQKEMAKIKGTHVLEVTSMGGDVPAQPGAASSSTSPSTASSSSGSVAGQVATDTATQTASSETGHLGVVGSALGNSVLGAFRRKKSTPPPAPAATAPAPAASTQAATTHVTMMEMTQQETNFSTEAIPASVFQVPANYKKVASPMQGR